jgi:hypothetical protein
VTDDLAVRAPVPRTYVSCFAGIGALDLAIVPQQAELALRLLWRRAFGADPR